MTHSLIPRAQIIVGMLYSLVTSRAVFFQIFSEKSIHRRTHTVKGWGTWVGIVTVVWVLAYVIGESIPFFGDLLSVSEYSTRAVVVTSSLDIILNRHRDLQSVRSLDPGSVTSSGELPTLR